MLGVLLILLLFVQAHSQTDSLPSWNDGPAKKGIAENDGGVAREFKATLGMRERKWEGE